MIYEVFDPTDGVPLFGTHRRWLARLVAKVRGLDWAAAEEGW